MDIQTIVIFGLATWRISSLLVHERGPFNTLIKFRKWVGIMHDMDGNFIGAPDRFWPQLFSCVWCCSFWVGIIVLGMWFVFPVQVYWTSIALTIMAVAIGFEKWVRA